MTAFGKKFSGKHKLNVTQWLKKQSIKLAVSLGKKEGQET
jgi:hypothetical protein